jgi:hypothetical protein
MSKTILLIQDDSVEAQAVHKALSASTDGSFKVEWVGSCADSQQRML